MRVALWRGNGRKEIIAATMRNCRLPCRSWITALVARIRRFAPCAFRLIDERAQCCSSDSVSDTDRSLSPFRLSLAPSLPLSLLHPPLSLSLRFVVVVFLLCVCVLSLIHI